MRLALLQPVQNALYNFSSEDQYMAEDHVSRLCSEMVDQHLSLLEQIQSCDLVVSSEAINFPGPYYLKGTTNVPCLMTDDIENHFSNFSRIHHCYSIADVYKSRGGKVYNEAVIFNRNGECIARYDKIHLAGSEQKALTAGDQYCTIDMDFGRIGICICWDMQFPEVCRHYAIEGAHLVVCPTWGWESIYSHARAYENGIYIAGAMSVPYKQTISGIRTPSEIIAPDGSVMAVASPDRAQVLCCDIDLSENFVLYTQRMHDRRPDTYSSLIKQ